MKIPSEFRTVIAVLMAVVILIFLVYGGGYLGFGPGVISDFAILLPGVTLLIAGILIVGSIQGQFVIAGFGAIGIGLALLSAYMNTAGVLIPDILTPTFTISDLQVVLVIGPLIVGAVVASRRD